MGLELPFWMEHEITKAEGRILSLVNIPANFKPEELAELYCGMQENVQLYHANHEDWDSKDLEAFFDHAQSHLDEVEFDSAWTVLRKLGEKDSKIRSYAADVRQARFIERLYDNQSRFVFFNSRQNALTKLSEIEAIALADYVPK
ncbi:hypothetical protein ACFL96_12690 [Thermoproteota archaeon]